MADDHRYVPGDWHIICDQSGRKVRASQSRLQWNNLFVRDQSFEMRQPQDFVQGVMDDQTVAISRDRQVNVFLGPLETTTSAAAAAGAQLIDCTSTVRMQIGDSMRVMLDTGSLHICAITDIPFSGRIQVNPKLPYTVASGNQVIDVTAYSSPNLDQ